MPKKRRENYVHSFILPFRALTLYSLCVFMCVVYYNVQLYIVNTCFFLLSQSAYTIYIFYYYGRVSDLNFITQSFLFGVVQLALAQRWARCALNVYVMCMYVSFENIHYIALTLHCALCILSRFTFSNSLIIMNTHNECARALSQIFTEIHGKKSTFFLVLSFFSNRHRIYILFWTRFTVLFNCSSIAICINQVTVLVC